MQRIDASKLLLTLCADKKMSSLTVILSENQIYKKIVEDNIYKASKKPAQLFSGKNAIIDYVEYAATGTLFYSQQSSIVLLHDKLTAKQWDEEKIFLNRLVFPLEASAYFFAPISFRNFIKELDFKMMASIFLCYEPNDVDLCKCSEILVNRYPSLATKSKKEIIEIANLAIETYSGNLLLCDSHFAQMENANLSFSEALVGTPEVNGFHVVDAIAKGDLYLIELRISQCEACGEDVSNIFMALVYFLKQVAFVMAELDEVQNIKAAFEKSKIPFPAQARIQRALKVLTKEKLIRFFIAAPKIELNLRTQKNAHKWLAAELIGWIFN